MAIGIALSGLGIATSLYGAYRGAKSSKAAGSAARDVAYANALDIMSFANANAGALQATAAINAGATRQVAYANAQNIEKAAERNIVMFAFGLQEEVYRHMQREKLLGGEAQVMAAASGWVSDRPGTTPRRMIEAVYDEGKRSRDFLKKRGALTILTMGQQAQDDAALQRLTGDVSANAMVANAAIGADMARLEGAMRAEASRREGDLALRTGNSAAVSTALSGISSALNSGYNLWSVT